MSAEVSLPSSVVRGSGALDVSIIIVSYNTRELTLACLRSLYEQTDGLSFETLIVDNASTDGSPDAISREFPAARLIALQDNLGFAAANNLAAKEARGEFLLLLLNPDTVVLEKAVQRLVAFARRAPGARIWGGRTVFSDGSLNPTSCWMRQTPWSLFCRGVGLTGLFRGSALLNPEAIGNWARDTERDVDIVTGCFFLIRREFWSELGGFDPAFFMYGEEADLCLRARRLGARPRITPEATIIHYGGASESVRADKLVRLLRARVQLIRRHWPPYLHWFGIWMTAQYCLMHSLAWRCVRLIRPRQADNKAEYWGAGWKRRREWMREPAAGAPCAQSVLQSPTQALPSKRILAISSGGGHWVQLLRLQPAFTDHHVTYVTVRDSYRSDVAGKPFMTVNDATRWDRIGLLKMGLRLVWIMLKVRPHVVISTGAAPGYFAIRLGRLLGARTVWIDSIANVEQMSMTGMLVRKHAGLWLTQWPHLAEENGPTFAGGVL